MNAMLRSSSPSVASSRNRFPVGIQTPSLLEETPKNRATVRQYRVRKPRAVLPSCHHYSERRDGNDQDQMLDASIQVEHLPQSRD